MLTDVAPVGLPEHRLPHFWDAWNHVLVSPASNSSPTPLLRPSLLKSKLGQEASLGLLDSQLFYKRPLGCGGPALPLTGSLPPVVLRSQLQISSLPCDPRVTMRLHLGTCYSFHPEYPCSSSSIFKLQLVIHALSPLEAVLPGSLSPSPPPAQQPYTPPTESLTAHLSLHSNARCTRL